MARLLFFAVDRANRLSVFERGGQFRPAQQADHAFQVVRHGRQTDFNSRSGRPTQLETRMAEDTLP
jgi:hypothetical protein